MKVFKTVFITVPVGICNSCMMSLLPALTHPVDQICLYLIFSLKSLVNLVPVLKQNIKYLKPNIGSSLFQVNKTGLIKYYCDV